MRRKLADENDPLVFWIHNRTSPHRTGTFPPQLARCIVDHEWIKKRISLPELLLKIAAIDHMYVGSAEKAFPNVTMEKGVVRNVIAVSPYHTNP